MALFGTNGLTSEHLSAIKEITDLSEIVFFLNGDQAGIKAVQKYAPMLKGEYPSVIISNVAVPENEDVNSLIQGHSGDILHHLVNTRKEYTFLFSNEQVAPAGDYKSSDEKEKSQDKTSEAVQPARPSGGEPEPVKEEKLQTTGLNTNNPYNLKYQGNEANYQIKGFKTNQLDSLKITLQIQIK